MKKIKYCDYEETGPEEYGVGIEEEDFHCHGSFGLMHKGRSNEEDLKNAKKICGKNIEFI